VVAVVPSPKVHEYDVYGAVPPVAMTAKLIVVPTSVGFELTIGVVMAN
jgi:hypothetical protein